MADEGIIALARAIDMHGLPWLVRFEMIGLGEGKVTRLGLSAIAYALIKGTSQSQLLLIIMDGCGEGTAFLEPMVKGMFRAAGRKRGIVVC